MRLATMDTQYHGDSGKPNWREIFGNDNPLRVEIGPGKGEFLLTLAAQEPKANYIAIEIRRKRVEKIKSKLARTELSNMRVYQGDAKQLLPELFSAASIEILFIHFPDPWPKRRHERRRLLNEDFVAVVYELLMVRGKVYLTTDVASYADTIAQLFAAKGFASVYAKTGHWESPYHCSIHEWKFKLRNRVIHYFCFTKA